MLAYAGKGKFIIKQVEINEAVEEIATLVTAGISKKASLSLQLAKGLPPVEADVAQLQQLLMNLITNASDALDDGPGQVTVTTSYLDADREYLDTTYLAADLPEGGYVCLEVSDEGCGMSEETRSRMFDPFYSTKPEGHGLGLAAAGGIVRSHHGAIKVESELGRGTCVKILLPAASQGEAPGAEPEAAQTPAVPRILVVDDEELILRLTNRVLTSKGYEVATAGSGEEARDLYEQGRRFDLVLLDLTLPGLGGEEIFRELVELDPDLRVLFSSGYNARQSIKEHVANGSVGFLHKPYTADELLNQVEAAFQRER